MLVPSNPCKQSLVTGSDSAKSNATLLSRSMGAKVDQKVSQEALACDGKILTQRCQQPPSPDSAKTLLPSHDYANPVDLKSALIHLFGFHKTYKRHSYHISGTSSTQLVSLCEAFQLSVPLLEPFD